MMPAPVVSASAVRAGNTTRDRLLIGAAIVCIAFALLQVLDFGYGRDQGIYATVARMLRAGGMPYRDAWDFKPPGIYFVYALADLVFGPAQYGIRVLEVASLFSMVVAFALISRRFLDDVRPGLLGAAFAIVTHGEMEFWHTAQPESFGAALVAWVIVASATAMDEASPQRARWWWFGCGLCSGLATLLKPTIGIAGAAAVLFALATGPSWRTSHGLRHAATVIIAPVLVGTMVPIGACVLFFAARGALPELIDAVFVFAPRYTEIAWERRDVGQLTYLVLRNWLLNNSAINAAGLALLLVPLPAGRTRRGAALIAMVLVALAFGVFLQARLFLYHYGSVLPLTGLLAGWGFWRLWERMRDRAASAAIFALFVATLGGWISATPGLEDGFFVRSLMRAHAWADAGARQELRDYLYSTEEYQAIDVRRVGEWVRTRTAPDAPLFVYGFTPELYLAAGRTPASRYIYNVPQRTPWSSDAARAELIVELSHRVPQTIVVEHRDFVSGVTGLLVDSAFSMREFPQLRTLIDSQYARVGTFGRLDVYRRVDRHD